MFKRSTTTTTTNDWAIVRLYHNVPVQKKFFFVTRKEKLYIRWNMTRRKYSCVANKIDEGLKKMVLSRYTIFLYVYVV